MASITVPSVISMAVMMQGDPSDISTTVKSELNVRVTAQLGVAASDMNIQVDYHADPK